MSIRISPAAATVVALLVLAIPRLAAQPTVAPTRAEVGEAANIENYHVRQSFELGYRYHSVGGSQDMYRSAVNFGNGMRLLSSSLEVDSMDGHGGYFDHIRLDTQGLGNDPYQFARMRVDKNRFYEYAMNWRSNAYFNPGARVSAGQQAINTVRDMQDHDVTFLPQSPLKFFLGFSRNTQTGPSLTTYNFGSEHGDEFPLFANIRRQQHEYRLGFELALMGWRLNAMHGWVNFKDDTPQVLTAPSAGNNPNDLTTLQSFQGSQPYHGNSPYWRVMLFKDAGWWSFNGRFTYVAGRRAFVQNQTLMGTARFGTPAGQQLIALGNAQRPALAANANFILFPTDELTITNQTTLDSIRVVGNAQVIQLTNGINSGDFLPFTYLGMRTISNATDLDYRPANWFGVRAGYQYSTRRVQSVLGQDAPGNPAPPSAHQPATQNNGLHTGLLGIRLRPVRSFTIRLDGEIGRADHPIYAISQRNFHALKGRAEYRVNGFRIAGFTRIDYNVNSTSLAAYASRVRQYGADMTWSPQRGRLSNFFVDLSYAKLHTNTLGSIFYFATINGNIGNFAEKSYYVSNIHSGTASLRWVVGRAEFSAGMSYIQDTGDGRNNPYGGSLVGMGAGSGSPGQAQSVTGNSYTTSTAFASAQTFPLRYLSPMGKISVMINENLRWNLGYQHYGYSEQFGYLPGQNTLGTFPAGSQNFRAHTGYSSLSFSF